MLPAKLFICFLCWTVIKGEINKHKVVIVGAGPSGIAAATELLKNNVSDFRVLEAENRIGGRVNSVKIANGYVDLGAEWCHGQLDNTVYNLIKDYNVLKKSDFSSDIWYSSNGILSDKTLHEEITNISSRFLLDSNVKADEKYKHLSVGEYVLNEYNNTILKKYQNDAPRLKISKEAISYYEHFVIGMESAFSWFDVSVDSKFTYCKGDQDLNWNGLGYKTILDVMMQKYPNPKSALPIDDKILLNKEVNRINWKRNERDAISIDCSDGTQYEADYVIFTPSVGVLKAQHKTLFQPQLPENKITAIENIGLGAVVKVVLEFPLRWWNDSSYALLWSEEDKQKFRKEFPNQPIKNEKHWLTDLSFLYDGENNPRVMIAWFAGENVPEIEKINDFDIQAGVMYAIRHFIGKFFNVSEPVSMIRSSWWSNPHFHGSWSYETVKGAALGVSLQNQLAQPLPLSGNSGNKPQLLFGGEATHSKYFSTVHGAIETGYREALRVIESIKLSANDS